MMNCLLFESSNLYFNLITSVVEKVLIYIAQTISVSENDLKLKLNFQTCT